MKLMRADDPRAVRIRRQQQAKRTVTAPGEEFKDEWSDYDRLLKGTSTVNGVFQENTYDIGRIRDGNGAAAIEGLIGHITSNSYRYDEWGVRFDGSGTGSMESFEGRVGGLPVSDDTADSGMFSVGHRNCAGGVLGRFISRDPIGHSGGLNLYAYPTNPVRFIDPSGLEPIWYGCSDGVKGGLERKFMKEAMEDSGQDLMNAALLGPISSDQFLNGLNHTGNLFMFYGHNYQSQGGILFTDGKKPLAPFLQGRPGNKKLPRITLMIGCNTSHDAPSLSKDGRRFYLGFDSTINGTVGASFANGVFESLISGNTVNQAIKDGISRAKSDLGPKLEARRQDTTVEALVQEHLVTQMVLKGNRNLRL